MNRSMAIKMGEFYKYLADATRIEIIHTLLEGEKSVGEIVSLVGHSQSAVSHQLRLLKTGRIVKARRDGHHIFYSIDDDHVEQLYRLGLDHLSHD